MSVTTLTFYVSNCGVATEYDSEFEVHVWSDADDAAEDAAEEFLKENFVHGEMDDELFVLCKETGEHYKFSFSVDYDPCFYLSRACGYPSLKPEGE